MVKKPGDILLRRYLRGSCTQREQQQVERWLEADPSHADQFEQFAGRSADSIPVAEEWIKAKVMRRIGGDIESLAQSSGPSGSMSRAGPLRAKLTVRWDVAAAVIMLMVSTCIGVYLFQNRSPVQETVYLKRTIPAGKKASFTLSDGSRVLLNSGSTLKFPKQFGPGAREIFLDGEAFFEVAADRGRPFRVHAGHLKTTVLGTAFNIKAFPGERQIQIAVEEGKVLVEKEKTNSPSVSMLVRPRQWATFNKKSGKLEKKTGDIRHLLAWKNGILLFHDKTVSEAVAMMERWYGTEITVENEAIKSCVLHGEHKKESLENILKALRFALNMEYEFTANGVLLTGGKCK